MPSINFISTLSLWIRQNKNYHSLSCCIKLERSEFPVVHGMSQSPPWAPCNSKSRILFVAYCGLSGGGREQVFPRTASTLAWTVLSSAMPVNPTHVFSPAASSMTDFLALLKAAWEAASVSDHGGWQLQLSDSGPT